MQAVLRHFIATEGEAGFTWRAGEMSRLEAFSDAVLFQDASDARALLIIYGLGFAAVFGVFTLLYLYAYRKRQALELNELEFHRTRHSLMNNVAMMLFGLGSALLALLLPAGMSGLAGFIYFGIGFYHWIAGTIMGKERIIREHMESEAQVVR